LFDFSQSFPTWVAKLSSLTSIEINNLQDYEAALTSRFNEFSKAECRLADQALNAGFKFESPIFKTAESAFEKVLKGNQLLEHELQNLNSYTLCLVGKLAAEQNWTLQLHIGAQRQTSTRLKKKVGGAGGYAAMGSTTDISALVSYLDALESQGSLPKIILYNLNPNDNTAFATLMGSFSEDNTVGKIQFGPAWWYNDHYEGIMSQLKALSAYGLLARSIGMTTDSRSFFSLSRHEYFRRILCQFISEWVAKGLLPDAVDLLGNLVKDISYNNPKKMFKK
jgi:glucuronate isomerase